MVHAMSAQSVSPTPYAWPIRAERLAVRAGRRLAVSGVDLALGPGVHGVLGPNGAGKTTLLRALATAARPAGGELELLGQPMHGRGDLRAVRRSLGYLPQAFGYYRRFTVREFVEYLAWLKEIPARDIPAAAQRAVDRVGLADRADSRLRTLSGGMLRRVGLAQAIVGDPALLLLDEPTTGIDPEQRLVIRSLLRELGQASCVVLATHLTDDATTGTHLMIMKEGQIVYRGAPGDLAEAGGDGPEADRVDRGYAALLAGHGQVRR